MLEDMDEKELRNYLDFLLWHYRVIDSFWYINVEKAYGTDIANHCNELVWEKSAAMAARKIKEQFNIDEKGLSGFLKAQKYFPWNMIVHYAIEELPQEIIYSVPNCPTQAARLKKGLDEYACKEMHFMEFKAFAAEIDPAIKVECIHAPLDPHPDDRFCQWRFSI